MERFTPLYAIAYAITNSMENLRFDKEGYFHVLVFYGLFYRRNRKIFSSVSIRSRNTRGSLEELEIAWKHSSYGLVFPLQFLVLPNFHSCFYKTENVFYFLIWAFNGGLDYWKLLYPQSLPECRTITTIRVQKRKVRNYLRSTSATLEFPTQTLLLFYSETDIVDEINIDRAVYNSGQTLDVFRITFSAFWLYEYLSIP